MRVLFLDFDGPLHPVSAIAGLRPGVVRIADAAKERDLFRWLPVLEELLSDHPDVGIVVHSAWRAYANNSELREILGGLADRFLGVTPVDAQRHPGIKLTVERFGIESYLILDDAAGEFPEGLSELCLVDPMLGLTEAAPCQRIRGWLLESAQPVESCDGREKQHQGMAC